MGIGESGFGERQVGGRPLVVGPNSRVREFGFGGTLSAIADMARVAVSPDFGPEIFIDIEGSDLPRQVVELGRSPDAPETGELVATWETYKNERARRVLPPGKSLGFNHSPHKRGTPEGLVGPSDGAGLRVMIVRNRTNEGLLEVKAANWVTNPYKGVLRYYTD